MKKFELSEEFILRAHSAACKDWKKEIEKEVPELFKVKQIEPKKWYKNNDYPNLVYLENKIKNQNPNNDFTIFGNGYGFNFTEKPIWQEGLAFADCREFFPATEEEVKTALMKEAKRRYEVGMKVKCARYPERNSVYDVVEIQYDGNGVVGNGLKSYLFKDGIWASIIEQPKPPTKYTIAQLEEKLNEKIEIVG